MVDEVLPTADEPASEGAVRGNPLLQLVAIPLLIVICFVLVVVLFSRLAHQGLQPEDLVRSLERADRDSWQNAVLLAQVLSEPQYASVKQDRELAGRLARLTEQHLNAGQMDPASIRLRAYLCRALGEFSCSEVVPALLRAARTRREAAETDVQQAAAEAMAVLAADPVGESLRQQSDASQVLQALTRGSTESGDVQPVSLRAAATFALGVLGGTDAERRLCELLEDGAADVRFNAALGLARGGDPRALPGLTAMLDPENADVFGGETTERGRAWKRELVVSNAIRALRVLVDENAQIQLGDAPRFLREISENDPLPVLRSQAREALQLMPAEGHSAGGRL